MTDVWKLPAIATWEKSCGKHPTQKPLCLLARIILASTRQGEWVLDPFAGSSTTGIAATLLGRRFLGIDTSEEFLNISRNRREEIENGETRRTYIKKLNRQAPLGFDFFDSSAALVSEQEVSAELPF